MGGSSSRPSSSNQEMYESHPPPYLDMNSLFRDGIPKMMKVADDMNRMTNYIEDLRNMTLGLVVISLIGVIGFLLIRFFHGRSKRRRRRTSRTQEDGPHSLPRYYYQSNYAPEPWDRPKSTFSHHSLIDEKKNIDTRGSPEDRKPPNGNINTYKPYTPIAPPEVDSSDESKRMDDSYTSSRATTVPNPMLITPTSHKRSLEPIKLMVEDLPYADNDGRS